MNRLDTLNYGPYVNKSNFLEAQLSPKAALNVSNHDHLDCGSPSRRKSFMMRKSILLPNGITLEQQLDSILSKAERSRSEARILYEAIKDFPFIKMLSSQAGDKNPLDYESILHLIRSIKFMKVETGDLIYSQDDLSDGNLYIIYSGEVSLVVKDPDLITARNYERFESEQKKRTIGRLGSKQWRSRALTPNIQGPGLERTDSEAEGESNEHVFQLLKSYMTSNFIPHKNVKLQAGLEGAGLQDEKLVVEKDLVRVSGITRALVKFKKVLKQKNEVLNMAKGYGVVRDRLDEGQYFGGTVMLELKKREETAFAMKDCELLVISFKELQLIKAIYSKKRIALRNFMFDSFPKLDLYQSEKVITGLLGTLEEKVFEANAQIVTEGQTGEYFYIVQNGTCEVSKEIIIDGGHALDHVIPQSRSLLRVKPNTKKKITLTTISKGVFFGDELVFHAQKYCYSVKVTSSKATVVAIKNRTFAARFPQAVFDTLKSLYQIKVDHYLDIIKSLIGSSQYENYELDQELLQKSPAQKKIPVFEKIEIKDLKNPLKLRSKKKIPTSLLCKPDINSARQTTSALSQRPLSPPRKGSMPLAPIAAVGGNNAPLNSPQRDKSNEGERFDFESGENVQESGEKSARPGHRPKNRSVGLVSNEAHSRGQSQGGIGQNLDIKYPLISGQRKEDNLDKVRDALRARTAINAEVDGLKMGMFGKDHISYIHSHKNSNKGLIDIKTLEESESKGSLTGRREAPNIENLRLGIDIDKDSKRQLMIKKMQLQNKTPSETPRLSSRREEKDDEELKSPKEPILPGILDGEYKSSPFRKLQNRLKLDASMSDNDSRTNGTPNPASASLSHRPKDHPSGAPSLFRNQSFSLAQPSVAKEVNVLDIEVPKNIHQYIAKKQHQKLKEKLFAGDFDESEIFTYHNIPSLPRTPSMHSKRDGSADSFMRDKPLLSEESIRGKSAAALYKPQKPSGMSNFEKQTANSKRNDESKCETSIKKVNMGIQWQDKQTEIMKQKGKMYKQLNKKSGIKAIFHAPPNFLPDFNVPKSAKAAF